MPLCNLDSWINVLKTLEQLQQLSLCATVLSVFKVCILKYILNYNCSQQIMNHHSSEAAQMRMLVTYGREILCKWRLEM